MNWSNKDDRKIKYIFQSKWFLRLKVYYYRFIKSNHATRNINGFHELVAALQESFKSFFFKIKKASNNMSSINIWKCFSGELSNKTYSKANLGYANGLQRFPVPAHYLVPYRDLHYPHHYLLPLIKTWGLEKFPRLPCHKT